MKRILSLTLIALLCCASFNAFAEDDPFAPERTDPEDAAAFDMEIPVDTPISNDVFGYEGYADAVTLTYETVSNSTYSLVLERPSDWTQIPGRHTLCYVESVLDGQTPARMALTRKTSTKELTDTRITNELISYLKVLANQYESFEVSELDKETSFMGQEGYSTYYSARSGDTSVRGYVIMAAINKYLYVFHFSASESAFPSYTGVMTHLREAIQVNQ